MKGAWERGGKGRWLLDSQRVHIWQSFAQGWPAQRHCAPVIAALQQQMKLSAGRWLYSDSRSTLSLQSVANKYVGFQSCQGRRWTVGQGAKRGAKAFPSPRNLFSMSLVTSPGHPFSVSHPKGPRAPDLTHCMPGEFCDSLSPSDSHHSLSLSLILCAALCSPCSRAKNIFSREKQWEHQTVQTVYDRMWFSEMRKKWPLPTDSVWKEIFIHEVSVDDEVKISSSEQHAGERNSTSLYFAVWMELTDHLQCESFSSFSSHLLFFSLV